MGRYINYRHGHDWTADLSDGLRARNERAKRRVGSWWWPLWFRFAWSPWWRRIERRKHKLAVAANIAAMNADIESERSANREYTIPLPLRGV